MATSALRVRVTVDGRVALTIGQAAERYGLAPSSMRAVLTRLAQAGVVIEPVAYLNGRTPLYGPRDLDAVMKARPGRGANLRGRGRKQS